MASALIAAGAVLGRVKLFQYALLTILLVPLYMINEHLVLDGGLGVTKGFVDSAGSVIIHAFGAYFGLGLAVALTSKKQREVDIVSDAASNRFSMIGSMVLWLFWPSFCCAVVPPAQFAATAVNTILALCGATASTYVFSSIFSKGKGMIGDMANAALAGGVAIGATCNVVNAYTAVLIGAAAGTLCVLGYAVIQGRLQKFFKIVDTCGVHNLHGMPGLLGGVAAIAIIPGIAKAQLVGIIVGTYSSIFFATPLLVTLRERTDKVRTHTRRVVNRRKPAPDEQQLDPCSKEHPGAVGLLHSAWRWPCRWDWAPPSTSPSSQAARSRKLSKSS